MRALLIFALALPLSAANSWYCSNTALGTHNGTSWANAWNCANVVWGGAGVVAGDSLYVDGGSSSMTYTATADDMFVVGASGTPGNRITIATGAKSPSPSGHSGEVIFDGANSYAHLINANSAQWIKLDGESSGTSNWVIQNGRNGHAPGGPYSTNDYAVGLTNVVSVQGKIITYFTIHDVSDGINAAAVANGPAMLEISYNTIYNVVGDHLINATGDGSSSFGSILIHHNNLTDHVDSTQSNYGPDCIQVTTGADIYSNHFIAQNAPDLGVQHPDFIQGPYWNWRIYNNFFDGRGVSGVQATANASGDSTTRYALFYNNVYDNLGGPGIAWAPDSIATSITLIVVNNTFVDNSGPHTQYSIAVNFSATSAVPNVTIENNIFYNDGISGTVQSVFIQVSGTGQQAGTTLDYNDINAGSRGWAECDWYYGGANHPMAAQAHGQSGAPSFLSYTQYSATNNYQLSSSDTAAVGRGLDLSSLIGTTDAAGTTRTAPWSIGAYQYLLTNPLLAPPTSVSGVSL